MSWTVACFCGTLYETPPDRCPTCAKSIGPSGSETHDEWVKLGDVASAASSRLGSRGYVRHIPRLEV
jgi:hypothetical protein